MSKFKVTQTVYMIASNRIVQPVIVRSIDEDMHLVGFEMAGNLWVHESRLFAKEEEAEAYLKQFKKDRKGIRQYRNKLH